MLILQNVDLIYKNGNRPVTALEKIDLKLEKGRSYALVGPSGCGKTSLLFLMAGLLNPTSGTILLNQQPLICPDPKMSLILQEYGLLPWKTVWENAALGLQLRKYSKEKQQQLLKPILKELELEACIQRYPSQLSGGQKQRVALARALALKPDLMLMDEPFSAIDALTRENLQNLILDIWQKKKITLVLVTHSIEEAVFLGQEIFILSPCPGRIVKSISNPFMGKENYRDDYRFHKLCSEIRMVLEKGQKSDTITQVG